METVSILVSVSHTFHEFQFWTLHIFTLHQANHIGKFLSHSACNPLVTLVTNHPYYSHFVHVWFKNMYELMTILNMSQSPLRRLGFLQHIGRLAVVIWETFLTRNRHVECKHRKPTPSNHRTPHMFALVSECLINAWPERIQCTEHLQKKVNIFQTKQCINIYIKTNLFLMRSSCLLSTGTVTKAQI